MAVQFESSRRTIERVLVLTRPWNIIRLEVRGHGARVSAGSLSGTENTIAQSGLERRVCQPSSRMRKKPNGHEYLGAGVEISGLSGELAVESGWCRRFTD